MPKELTPGQKLQLLRHCGNILNAHQNIEDALDGLKGLPLKKLDQVTRDRIKAIQSMNKAIGGYITKLLPG